MKADDLIDIIGNTDDRIIEEAKKIKRPVQSRWTIWAAAAACICLTAGGLFAITLRSKTTPGISENLPQITIPKSENLPQITIPKYESGGQGFEGLMYYSADELNNGNPWSEDLTINTLPVFRNSSYDPSGAGMPFGLTEAEMTAELEKAAKVLGLEILETRANTNATKSKDGTVVSGDTVYSIRAITGNGNLTVSANGSLVYNLPDSYELPEGYNFTYNNTSDEEAAAVMAYLTETYASLLNYAHPEIVLQGDYTFSGDYTRRYLVYDAGTDLTERILNYNLCPAQFAPDDNGNLMLIRINNGLRMAEKLGDYPLISVAEAKEKLLNGQYQTSVPVAMPGEKYIVKVELVYRSGPREETLLPYYRFYVELQDTDKWLVPLSNGLKTYGAYYVPAIQDEYISNLSTYNGYFN